MRKRHCFLALALGLSLGLQSVSASDPARSPFVTGAGIGGGAFSGGFLRHLERDGAYPLTPATFLFLEIYPLEFLGIRSELDGASVINSRSSPIEGTLFYQGVGPVVRFSGRLLGFAAYSVFGFQYATMQLTWYSSGYWQAGLRIQAPLSARVEGISVGLDLAYRRGMLPSQLLPEMYNLEYPVVSETFLICLALMVAMGP